jgi:hypothetical protein
VNLADFVRHARVEQNTLGRGGLPRVDMSGNTDVPVSLDGRTSWHMFSRRLRAEFNGADAAPPHSCSLREHKE